MPLGCITFLKYSSIYSSNLVVSSWRKMCNFLCTHRHTHDECSPMARRTWVQSQVKSYQRLKKWYLMLPCLILSVIRYGSRVKWSNPEKGVAPSPTHWCSSYRKGSLWVTLDYGRQLYFTYWHSNPE